MRLRDRVAPGLRVLFVGINPGVRSAVTGHHFAGYSNRFWKLLWESRLVPEPVTFEDDDRLTAWGFGITNLIARPSPGIDDLRPAEYVDGWRVLERKVARLQPSIVALIGVTLYRAVLPLLGDPSRTAAARSGRFRPGPAPAGHSRRARVRPPQSERPQRQLQLRRDAGGVSHAQPGGEADVASQIGAGIFTQITLYCKVMSRPLRVKFILPALTEATSPYWRPIKYSLFPPLGLATLAAYLAARRRGGDRRRARRARSTPTTRPTWS